MIKSTPDHVYLALILALFGCLGFAAQKRSSIDRVSWLAGCWEARDSRRVVYEQWTSAQGRVMLSTARTVRGDSLINYEFVALREKGERLAYEAHPSGQPGVTFVSIALTDTSVTFENPANDFPTRLGYNRRGVDSVIAWISGPSRGTTRKIDYPYRRVACETNQ